VSFDVDDAAWVADAGAWGANQNDDFVAYNRRGDVAIDSRTADPIKRALSDKIDRAIVLVCVVGATTSQNRWVSWEVDYARSAGKYLLGVLLQPENRKPDSLVDARAIFSGFDDAEIREAIGSAVIFGALRRSS
jgi:MTH538 TIR-like domain (DUF1863)